MGQRGFCENLRFPAVFCENLRFPAVFCENLRPRNAVVTRKSKNLQTLRKSAKNCESRAFVPFSLSLLVPPDEWFGEKLKGRLLKGSLDKACALTCRFLCLSPLHHPQHPQPPPPHPLPLRLFLIFHRQPPPTTRLSPSSRDTNRNSRPFAENYPGTTP